MTAIYHTLLFAIIITSQIITYAQHKTLAQAQLIADSYSPQKDSIITLGVLINLDDDWHIYWRNPGDSGLPTDIVFNLPDGLTISKIKFPIPDIFYSDEIVNYGYAHQVLLIADLNVPNNYGQKKINISAKLTSLICKALCKSFDTTVVLTLDLSKEFIAEDSISRLFELTERTLPKQISNMDVIAESISNHTYLKAFISEKERQRINEIRFYPYDEGIFKNSAKQNVVKKENYYEILLEADAFRIKEPSSLNGIIIIDKKVNHNLSREAYEIAVPIIKKSQ